MGNISLHQISTRSSLNLFPPKGRYKMKQTSYKGNLHVIRNAIKSHAHCYGSTNLFFLNQIWNVTTVILPNYFWNAINKIKWLHFPKNLFVFNTWPMLLYRSQKYVMYGLLAEAMHWLRCSENMESSGYSNVMLIYKYNKMA